MSNIEQLYNECLERVTLGDIEAGEQVLISCITYLMRARVGRCDRDRVEEDISWNRGLEKYLTELQLIANLNNDELSVLVSNNFSATPIVNEARRIYDMVTTSNVQNGKEAKQILVAVKMFLSIAKIIGGLDLKVVKSTYTQPKRKVKRSRGKVSAKKKESFKTKVYVDSYKPPKNNKSLPSKYISPLGGLND